MLVLLLFLSVVTSCAGWGNSPGKRVLLKDVQAITLREHEMTTGRRSSPMPQLQCVNQGSASCSGNKPKMVQCLNRGSDGVDIQWECKGDMDRSIKFGSIEVSCEGYEYPDDPYILAGSCGLSYSLDYMSESRHKEHHHSTSKHGSSSWKTSVADLIVYCAIGLMVYALYKSCTSPQRDARQEAYSNMSDDYPSGDNGGGYGWFGGRTPSGTGYHDTYDAGSCRNRGTYQRGNGGAGFWTGAATGGLLGYMFGQTGQRNAYRRYDGGGGSSWGSFGGGNSYGDSSSSTYTSSGFGGTSRR